MFESVSVHFTLTTNTKRPLNIRRAARRLLAADLARSAAWPSEGAIRVSQQFRAPARFLRTGYRLHGAYDRFNSNKTVMNAIRVGRHNPRLGFLTLRAALAKRAVADFKAAFTHERLPTMRVVLFIARHPYFFARHVLPDVRFSRRKDEDPNPELDWGNDADQSEGIAEDEAASKKLMDSLLEAEKMMLDQQLISAAEQHNDALLLGGRDRDEGRFVRLVLRGSYHDLLVPGGGGKTHHVVLEPRLFIHESGTVQLTLRIHTDGPLRTADVVGAMWGTEPLVQVSEMSKPLLKGTSWRKLAEWKEEKDADQPLGRIEHSVPSSITDLLMIHIVAIGAVVGRRLPQDWFNYPTAIISVGACCKPGQWQKSHAAEIEKVRIRYRSAEPILEGAPPTHDFSRSKDSSLFINAADTTYWQWHGKAPFGLAELNTTLLIEYALYLFRRLEMLEREVTDLPSGNRRLRRLFRRAILVFAELRQGNLRSGDAREIAAHLLRLLGGDEIRTTVTTALELSGMAHATVSAAKAARRAWWLALLGTVVAVVVAHPQIEDALRPIATLQDQGRWEWLVSPLRDVAAGGPWAVLVAGVITALVAARLPGAVRFVAALVGAFWPRGFAWPTRLTVEESKEEDDKSSDL